MIILKKLKSQMNGSLFSNPHNTTFNTYEQTIQSENGTFFHSHKWIDLSGNFTANVYRQTTDKLMLKSVISTVR